MTTEQVIIIDAIIAERKRQDQKWGGVRHDDAHSRRDWVAFIVAELGKPGADNCTAYEFEEAMVRIASLAVAATEAVRRITARI